ncbi:MAG: hypothetical protein PHU98_01810 [Mariniphaga sp.]|nr:hypothetical protein [Mariniphaga sp.]
MTSKFYSIALIFLLIQPFFALGGANEPGKGFNWDPAVLEEALKAQPIRWQNDPNVNTEYTGYWVLYSGKALNYLALVAFYDTGNAYPRAAAKVVEQLKYVISGGKEPCCRGVIAGWADNALAQTLALAKHTEVVWSQFSNAEKEKLDLLMEALAIAGNYCQNSSNNVHRGLYQAFSWRKGWNPNHQEGYVGVMVAAHIYFGGTDQVNEVFKNFSYDDYMNRFQEAGFTTVSDCWSATGKVLMEEGGTDAGGGTTKGVRMPFRYASLSGFGELEYEPYLLYRDLAVKMFKHHVTSGECDGKAFIADGTTSPWQGQPGMCYEFRTFDASGCRSSASYGFEGWMNHILTLSTLQAFELLPGDDNMEYNELVKRTKTGTSDLFYKLERGYQAHKNGKSTIDKKENLNRLGIVFLEDLYNVIKDKL